MENWDYDVHSTDPQAFVVSAVIVDGGRGENEACMIAAVSVIGINTGAYLHVVSDKASSSLCLPGYGQVADPIAKLKEFINEVPNARLYAATVWDAVSLSGHIDEDITVIDDTDYLPVKRHAFDIALAKAASIRRALSRG